VLSNILQTGTNAFLDRLGIRPGMSCLDVGCGGGDVTRELARRAGSSGQIVGLDVDAAQVNIIREEALAQNLQNITYRVADVTLLPDNLGVFDVVYTRFLLCHLPSRLNVLNWMVGRLKPGGVLAVEDCDFSGHFCYPPSKEFARYVDLAGETMRRRGGDPELGLKLPSLFVGEGLQLGGIEVAHPADVEGDAKLLNALTIENFADSIVVDGLATADEVRHLVATLSAAVDDTGIFASITRRIQVWGRRMCLRSVRACCPTTPRGVAMGP
jgi:SAM-dependent methyltransferase